jgi:hypothetical protein
VLSSCSSLESELTAVEALADGAATLTVEAAVEAAVEAVDETVATDEEVGAREALTIATAADGETVEAMVVVVAVNVDVVGTEAEGKVDAADTVTGAVASFAGATVAATVETSIIALLVGADVVLS